MSLLPPFSPPAGLFEPAAGTVFGVAGGFGHGLESPAWGTTIANDILTWRATDGASVAGSTPYSPVGTVGYWQQTSQYAADFNTVKDLGAQFSLTRTADETSQAYF